MATGRMFWTSIADHSRQNSRHKGRTELELVCFYTTPIGITLTHFTPVQKVAPEETHDPISNSGGSPLETLFELCSNSVGKLCCFPRKTERTKRTPAQKMNVDNKTIKTSGTTDTYYGTLKPRLPGPQCPFRWCRVVVVSHGALFDLCSCGIHQLSRPHTPSKSLLHYYYYVDEGYYYDGCC